MRRDETKSPAVGDGKLAFECLTPLAWRLGPWRRYLVLAALVLAPLALAANVMQQIFLASTLLLLSFFYFGRSWLVLDHEGVSRRFRGVTRRIPYGSIVRAEPVQRLGSGISHEDGAANEWEVCTGVRLELANGALELGTGRRVEKLSFGRGGRWTGMEGAFVFDPIGQRIVQEIRTRQAALAEARRPADPLTKDLSRGGRSAAEWLAGLRAMLPDARAGYRAASVPLDRFWYVLEDANALPTARLGAAIALQRALDDEGRQRLRVAVEDIDLPRLRVALEQVIDCADDDAHTLRELDAFVRDTELE